jgi:thioredoxin 1
MTRRLLLAALLALAVAATALAAQGALPVPKLASPAVPVKGMVTMVDLGAKSCIPCKMMAPILVEMEKEYRGKAAVVFIDVREDYDAARKFGIRAIPTQIFYDKTGREVSRHEGFMDKKAISAKLNQLLAK